MSLRRVLLAAGALGLAVAGGAKAETRALLVGEYQYTSSLIPPLKGPPNDMAAMDSLLRSQGAKDIVTLRNGEATRTSIETALRDMGARAKPGDWIVFYYSGHGAQAKALDKTTEADGLDEFLVLSGFDFQKPDPEQYIIDDDLRAWLGRYIPADVHVLQIADSCHSGTLNRSIDRRAWRFTPRLAKNPGGYIELKARPAPKYDAVLERKGDPAPAGDLPNLIFLGAAQDNQYALEAGIPVETAPVRGMMTYSLEEALTLTGADGKTLAADTDGDGKLTVGELADYLDSQTRTLTSQRQESSAHFAPGVEKLVLFSAAVPAKAAPAAGPARPSVYVADPSGRAKLAGGSAWTIAASPEADFVWDPAAGTVLRRSGDVVAERITDAAGLTGVLGKWAAVEALRPLLAEGDQKVLIGNGVKGARHPAGEHVDLIVAREAKAPARYLTVFNIASDGEVQILYPLAANKDGDGLIQPGKAPPSLATEVTAPFGVDHVVMVATKARPDALRETLAKADGTRIAPALVGAIKAELAKGEAGLSIGELYTGP